LSFIIIIIINIIIIMSDKDNDTDVCPRVMTDNVFEEWGWSLSRDDEHAVAYAMERDPYNDFSIVRGERGYGFTVSVPLPRLSVQYITTMDDFSDACAFLRAHLEYFMETHI
tara:strand:+ start:105 stop:440 length:336 start_codon:yes stop_codon:yes gene_type:complete